VSGKGYRDIEAAQAAEQESAAQQCRIGISSVTDCVNRPTIVDCQCQGSWRHPNAVNAADLHGRAIYIWGEHRPELEQDRESILSPLLDVKEGLESGNSSPLQLPHRVRGFLATFRSRYLLGKDRFMFYNSPHSGTIQMTLLPGICVFTRSVSKERPNMKKLLTLLFAIALCLSLSSFAFAQNSNSDTKADKKEEKVEKKVVKKERRHHKTVKKMVKKEEKTEEKK